MKYEKLKEELNKIEFMGCEGVHMGDALHYPIYYMPERNLKTLCKNFLSIAKKLTTNYYQFSEKGDGNTLFLFSSSYGIRTEQKVVFRRIRDLANHYISMEYSSMKFQLGKRTIYGVKSLYHWYKQMNRVTDIKIELYKKIYLMNAMLSMYMDYQIWIDRINKTHKKAKNLVVWCDVHSVDSFFVQKFNYEDKRTVTLQHGFLSSKYNRWFGRGAESKYFFADSIYTRSVLMECGYRGEIVICGSPYWIGYNAKKFSTTGKIKRIGIFLCSEELSQLNREILHFFRNFSIRHDNVEILVKFHPTSKISLYERDINKFPFKVYGNNISAVKFIEKIDMAIVSFSNTFIEVLNAAKPVFLFQSTADIANPFPFTEKIMFDTLEDLEELLDTLEVTGGFNEFSKLRTYYCVEEDIKEKYRSEMQKIGIY